MHRGALASTGHQRLRVDDEQSHIVSQLCVQVVAERDRVVVLGDARAMDQREGETVMSVIGANLVPDTQPGDAARRRNGHAPPFHSETRALILKADVWEA